LECPSRARQAKRIVTLSTCWTRSMAIICQLPVMVGTFLRKRVRRTFLFGSGERAGGKKKTLSGFGQGVRCEAVCVLIVQLRITLSSLSA
jgi:hypothetical protein